MRSTRLLTAAAATATLAVLAAPASAAGPKLSAIGLGSASSTADGGASYSGEASGSPIHGTFTGEIDATDGSLPAVGTCEPARGTLRVQDQAGAYYRLSSDGQVCSWYLPLGVMHQFTGRWSVESSSMPKLRKSTGSMDVRVLNGTSDIYAVS